MTAVVVGALSGTAMLALAAGPNDNRIESKAYVTFNFGGERALPRNFHYGMRLDHDQRFTDNVLPPIASLDFNQRGFNVAHLNGLPVVRRMYRLNQSEGATAETVPVEGGADAGAAAGAGAGEAAAAGSAYTVADWGLIALGAVGVGYAGYEVSKSDDNAASGGSNNGSNAGGSPTGGSPTGGSPTGGGATGGGLLGGILSGGGTGSGSPTGGSPTGGSPTGGGATGGILGYGDSVHAAADERISREYLEWLDGGSGQMGDLNAR